MPQDDMLHIGCLVDGRTVYIAPAGLIDLEWLRRKHPHVKIERNASLGRDEIEYSALAYMEFLAHLREDGWHVVGASASNEEETLRFVRNKD